MKAYRFKCTMLSDVVLTSNTATEGLKDSLTYIPGSKFLGITAGELYDMSNVKQTLDLFHNGTVRFGDAHPLIDGYDSYPAPFSWSCNKGENLLDKIYIHHALEKETIQKLAEAGIQLKQQRAGYLTHSGKLLEETPQFFSIKSAYDMEKRRSKDSQMYGYFALPKGSVWSFTVEDDTGKYIEQIKEMFEENDGIHRIGRSRSAQYGRVKIEYLADVSAPSTPKQHESVVLLYAASNLAFYENGQTTLQPDPIDHLGLPNGSRIDWSKSQIRTRIYQTWNRHRHNRDADRSIIVKGSVFYCELSKPIDLGESVTLGSHQAEGFGKVLVNPSFLTSVKDSFISDFALESVKSEDWLEEITDHSSVQPTSEDQRLLAYLHQQKNKESSLFSIDQAVNNFITGYREKYQGVTSSQWGMVANYARYASNKEVLNDLLFGKAGCLMQGKSEEQWKRRNRREILKRTLFDQNNHDPIQLVIRIATEMPKNNNV